MLLNSDYLLRLLWRSINKSQSSVQVIAQGQGTPLSTQVLPPVTEASFSNTIGGHLIHRGLPGLWPINFFHYENNNYRPWIVHFQALEKMGNTWIPSYLNNFWGILSLSINAGKLWSVHKWTDPCFKQKLHSPTTSQTITNGKNNCKNTEDNFLLVFFFLQLKEQSSNNKWFCVKSSLPSDLKLNTSFSCTASKAKDMKNWSWDTGARRGIFTSHPTDTLMQTHFLPAEWSWTKCPLPCSGKDADHQAFVYFCLSVWDQGKGVFFLISPMEALSHTATESTAATQLESCLATEPNSTFSQKEEQR